MRRDCRSPMKQRTYTRKLWNIVLPTRKEVQRSIVFTGNIRITGTPVIRMQEISVRPLHTNLCVSRTNAKAVQKHKS
jgi:hypothetical protein